MPMTSENAATAKEHSVEQIDQRHMPEMVVSVMNLSWDGWQGGTLLDLLDEADDVVGTWVAWGCWTDAELMQHVPAFSVWQ